MDQQEPFTEASLGTLYAAISAPDGVTVAELALLVSAFSGRPVSKADLQAYREGDKPWKKLRDEVVPVERFLAVHAAQEDRIRFPLDDNPPDAWLLVAGEEPVGVEVTGALARAGIEVGKSLAEGKPVPGFIALQDDASNEAFAKVKARGRITNAANAVDAAIDRAIGARLKGKDKAKYAGHILLINATLGSSPNRSAAELKARHAEAAAALPFAAVYVLDAARRSSIVQLK